MNTYLLTLALYDAWANQELMANIPEAVAADPRVAKLLGHLIAAKRVWLARVDGLDTFHWELWPIYSRSDANRLLPEADAVLLALTRRDDAALDHEIKYRNQTGTYFTTKLSDLVIHLVNHGTYHRGQLAPAVKAAGGTPAVTDYIAWLRAGSPSPTNLV